MYLGTGGGFISGFDPGALRQRSQIQFCIDAFVEETAYVPANARYLRAPSELSPQLERLVGSLSQSSGWRAWAEGERCWFVEGSLLEVSDHRPDRPTVSLIFRDQDARPVAGGAWCRIAPARWDLLQFKVQSCPP